MSFLINPFLGGGGGAGSSFKTITIDHTQCGTADSTDFPIPVKGTYAYLADTGHGGDLASVNNLAFYSDSGLTTLLKFERVRHDLTTGDVLYWVKIPTLSHTADTVIYMAWDASTSDRSDAANVWTANFQPVVHTGDGSTLTLNDSTAAGQNFTNNGSIAAASGVLYGAANIAGASQQYASSAVAALTTYPATFSAWVKLANTSFSSGEERVIIAIGKESALVEFWVSYYHNGTAVKLRAVAQNGGSVLVCTATPVLDTNWRLIHGVFVDFNTLIVYQDGVNLGGNISGPTTAMSGLDHTYIGGLIYNTSNFYGQMRGLVEEPRIASVVRSTSWITAEYNSQKSGSTFYAVT